MKRKKINNKGITLITLVITIIVIVILASVATYSGVQVIESSKLTRFTAEMKLIQAKINEIYEDENKKSELQKDTSKIATTSDLGTSLNNFNDWGYSQDINSYKKYTKADLKNIGVDDIQQEKVLIDFEKRKVISSEGVKADGITYYVLEQLPNSVYNVEHKGENSGKPTFEADYENMSNGKSRITISNINYDGNIQKWNVKYKKSEQNEEEWNTSDNLNFIVEEKGIYNIKIENKNISSDVKDLNVKGIEIGDYVNYTYDEFKEYEVKKEYSGSDKDTTISQDENLKWRIMNIDKTNNTVDLISDRTTSNSIKLQGASGYNNGVYLINDICKKQYSNLKLGIEARSLNMEDIENAMNSEGILAKNNYIYESESEDGTQKRQTKYGETTSYSFSTGISWDFGNGYPNLYKVEEGAGINTKTTNKNGVKRSDKYYSSPTTETSTKITDEPKILTVTQTGYILDLSDKNYFDEKFYDTVFEKRTEENGLLQGM